MMEYFVKIVFLREKKIFFFFQESSADVRQGPKYTWEFFFTRIYSVSTHLNPVLYFIQKPVFFFFLSGLSFTNIHKSQDCRGRGGHSLTPLCHSHPLHRYLDISRAITKEILPLQSVGKRTGTGNPPSYALFLHAIQHD